MNLDSQEHAPARVFSPFTDWQAGHPDHFTGPGGPAEAGQGPVIGSDGLPIDPADRHPVAPIPAPEEVPAEPVAAPEPAPEAAPSIAPAALPVEDAPTIAPQDHEVLPELHEDDDHHEA